MKKSTVLLLSAWLCALVPAIGQYDLTKPEQTEVWDPEPKVVTPAANPAAPPSDAIVLFDGTQFDQWTGKDGNSPKWSLKEGSMTVVGGTGEIKTKESFGDIQLHVEWRSPIESDDLKGQGKGNSGIFLQERYEVQVLNSYQNRTYANGQAGSIYKQYPPFVNACRKPGEWNTYDIIYIAPRFRKNGSVESPAYITVLHNGVIVQNHAEVQGETAYIGAPSYKAHGTAPIMLQDHGNAVSYRNIWLRKL
jgi:hypothetical protein